MPEVAEQQEVQQQEEGVEKKVEKTFTQAEWDARQQDFDSKANKIRRNAAREAELRFRREQDAQRGQGQQQEQRQQAQDTELKEPKREEFESYEEYLEARSSYAGKKAAREERTRAQHEEGVRKAAESKASLQADFRKRSNAVMDEIKDFGDVIESAEETMITESMGDAILESEVGPRILYKLAKDPAEAERISKLSKTAQVREIGKMEAKIEAELEAAKLAKEKTKNEDGDGEEDGAGNEGDEAGGGDAGEERPDRDAGGRFKAPQEKETRKKAPDPIEPVAGRGANSSAAPSDKDSDQAWYEKELARKDRERKSRRAG